MYSLVQIAIAYVLVINIIMQVKIFYYILVKRVCERRMIFIDADSVIDGSTSNFDQGSCIHFDTNNLKIFWIHIYITQLG